MLRSACHGSFAPRPSPRHLSTTELAVALTTGAPGTLSSAKSALSTRQLTVTVTVLPGSTDPAWVSTLKPRHVTPACNNAASAVARAFRVASDSFRAMVAARAA
ncbi:hypothetical protein GCM10023214_45600 [Amycolatopsis dongchuanensis]|uniref:Uncharacterized protein n=1 Tax=Amycolatopsis dongchuanensis TaxID=1070866 RepID=A0ABP9QYB8_9PSEU